MLSNALSTAVRNNPHSENYIKQTSVLPYRVGTEYVYGFGPDFQIKCILNFSMANDKILTAAEQSLVKNCLPCIYERNTR